jgi:hypothetical protein
MNDIVNRANDVFDFTILTVRVWTRHLELCLFRQKKCLGGIVVKLTSIFILDGLDSATELSSSLNKEVGQCGEGVRFKFKWKSP